MLALCIVWIRHHAYLYNIRIYIYYIYVIMDARNYLLLTTCKKAIHDAMM